MTVHIYENGAQMGQKLKTVKFMRRKFVLSLSTHVRNIIMSVVGTKYIKLIDPRKIFHFLITKLAAKSTLYKKSLTING